MALLEIQVADLDQDVNFLLDEHIIHDERLLNLETETQEIDEQLIIVDDDLHSKFFELILFIKNTSKFQV